MVGFVHKILRYFPILVCRTLNYFLVLRSIPFYGYAVVYFTIPLLRDLYNVFHVLASPTALQCTTHTPP